MRCFFCTIHFALIVNDFGIKCTNQTRTSEPNSLATYHWHPPNQVSHYLQIWPLLQRNQPEWQLSIPMIVFKPLIRFRPDWPKNLQHSPILGILQSTVNHLLVEMCILPLIKSSVSSIPLALFRFYAIAVDSTMWTPISSLATYSNNIPPDAINDLPNPCKTLQHIQMQNWNSEQMSYFHEHKQMYLTCQKLKQDIEPEVFPTSALSHRYLFNPLLLHRLYLVFTIKSSAKVHENPGHKKSNAFINGVIFIYRKRSLSGVQIWLHSIYI